MKKIIILLFIVVLIGCSSKNKFIGTWYHVDGNEVVIISFYEDGKCLLEELNEEQNCTYEFDNEKITIKSSLADAKMNYSFINNYVLIGDTRFYKDLKEAKDNKDDVSVHTKEVVGNRIQKVKVPDVIGMKYEDVKSILEKEGFVINIIKEENNYYEDGIIIKTSPGVGEIVDKNKVLDIYISANNK